MGPRPRVRRTRARHHDHPQPRLEPLDAAPQRSDIACWSTSHIGDGVAHHVRPHGYAQWCHHQRRGSELPNAVAVAFYQHLFDNWGLREQIAVAAACVIAGRAARDRVEVLSFHVVACEEAARQGLASRLVIWADYAPDALGRWAQRAGVAGVCVEHFLLHRGLVEQLRGHGLSVTTGTINDAGLAARAATLGVDSITTDRPAALRRELTTQAIAA